MTYRCQSISTTLFLTLFVLLMGGCPSVAPSGPDYPADSLALSDANDQSLDQITDRFLALLGAGSNTEAATALMAELQGGLAGVALAELGDDGSAILLQMGDGSVALLNTNRSVFGAEEVQTEASQAAQAKPPAAYKTVLDTQARTLPGSFECPGKDTPSTRNVLIINAAAVSNPSTDVYVQQIQDALIAQGWPETSFDVRSRTGIGDRDFAPTSLTQCAGYGLVFVVAQGCTANVGGVMHSYIQCCRPGTFKDILRPDDLTIILRERDKGRLIRCQTPAEGGGFVKDIYARDDYLIEQMKVSPGAMVYFVTPHSWSVANGLAGAGAGSTLGWEGAFDGDDGQRTLLGMLSRMTADNTLTTDSQAYSNCLLAGLGLSHDPAGHATGAKIAGTAGDFFMPAWGVFTVDMDNVPSDTASVQVDVTYADCPDFSLSFDMIVSDTVDTLRLPSGIATVEVKALDDAGSIIGMGLSDFAINGGENAITLATCKTKVSLYLDEHPTTGANAMSRLRIEFVYPYTLADPPLPAELNTADISGWSAEIPAGSVSVRSTALNTAGKVVAEQFQDTDIPCGIKMIDVCFGWAKLESTRYPPDTASIRVVSDNENAPGPFILTPGGSVEVYGLRVDGTVNFTAEALNASGDAIASRGETVTIACGENTVALDLIHYGITVSADPNEIAADGHEQSHITATLRYWQAGDTTAPTGPPIAGKQVHFATTLGTLTGSNPVISDANGRATIDLSGTTDGLATVVATVTEDLAEGKCLVQIGNAGSAKWLTVFYGAQGQEQPGATGLVTAFVKDADQKAVQGTPVRFRLVAGSIGLDEPLETITNQDGAAHVVVRSDAPAIGLVEATVPGTLLAKRCVAYLQFTCTLSPPYANIEIDNAEQPLEVDSTVDICSLGVPCGWGWHTFSREGRLIRGGTDAAECMASIIRETDTRRARIRGTEPDTGMGITVDPYIDIESDGHWEQFGWVPSPGEIRVDFFQNIIATLTLSIESRSRVIAGTPKRYEAKVVARFTGSGPSGNIRYIVHNPKDHGQVGGDWYDGSNRRAVSSGSPISIVMAQATYFESQPPDTWLAEKVQAFKDSYEGLSISVSSYPFTVTPVAGDISGQSFDPWQGW